MMAGWRNCVALTRSGLRVRNVCMKLSPGGTISPPKTFQHLIHKKGVIVFVDFRKGFSSRCLSRSPVAFTDEAYSMATRLNLSGFSKKRVGFVISEVDHS